MQNMSGCKDCPYAGAPYYCSYLAMQNPYSYFKPNYQGFYRFDGDDFEDMDELEELFEDESFSDVMIDDDFMEKIEDVLEDEDDDEFEEMRAPQDVERVIRQINQRAAREINEIVRIGMDRKLLDYLIRSMVIYIDRNYNRYQGNRQQKIQMAERDLRRNLPWVFDIMNLYSVSPATQARLVNIVVTTSIDGLRRPPVPPTPPPTPMPR